MMQKNMKKRLFLLLGTVAAVLLALAAFLFWDDLTGEAILQGKVVNPEGQPLKGIEVVLFTNEGFDEHTILAEGVTNWWNGKFTLRSKNADVIAEIKKIDEAVLLVSGNEGEGRKLITQFQGTANLEITYPVVETVVLLHDNDLHFNFNHRELFKAKVEEIRERYDDVYLLNAGDIFVRTQKKWVGFDGVQKNSEWYAERSLFMIETMNEMGYDVMTAGNHDFVTYKDYTGKALEAARFPILAANAEITTDLLPPVLPYVVFTTSTYRRIAVLGLTTSLSEKAGRELDRYETVEKYLYLSDDCDIFLALTHLEVKNDVELAERFPQIDVIIGGHSHALLEKGEFSNSVLVVQAGGNENALSVDYPKYLGMVILTLENGRIVNKEAQVYKFEIPLYHRIH